MKALVVYESMFGNTEAVARAVADGLRETFEVNLSDVRDMLPATDVDLLVVGSPTHAFGLSRPATRADAIRQGAVRDGAVDVGLREYLGCSPVLDGIGAAAFDTRINKSFVPGSAARKARRELRRLGCRMVWPAQSFHVTATAGPLVEGELSRARIWASNLSSAVLSERHQV
ncbi:flavodoxin domain-containing protein [Actinoplanes sp. NPDC026623]|uniref:flavodoxin family protein n=1 Tax=Actinoplanes sp. NPDC026623 TaxID=3155610 RepID=UPI0033C2F091